MLLSVPIFFLFFFLAAFTILDNDGIFAAAAEV
jgi:hypothetical protein